jgi:hypothetical protein
VGIFCRFLSTQCSQKSDKNNTGMAAKNSAKALMTKKKLAREKARVKK